MNNPFSLEGKNILITGASSGIGESCAIECSKMGANIIAIGRDEQRLQSVYSKLNSGKHLTYSQDTTQFDKLEGLVKDAVSKLGNISGFVHSAGIELTLPLRSMNRQKYETLFSTNVIAGFEIAKIVSKKKHLSSQNSSYVFISSIMGEFGQAGKVGYCSSKGAIIAGVKAMALELVQKKIRVNSIAPAVIKTKMVKQLFETIPDEAKSEILEMHPMGLGSPEDVANACIFLLSDAAKWITGTNLIVDGGYSAR